MSQKPGSLYLGQALNPADASPSGDRLLLSSDRLTTHGVIVGMTGSGKTGLGIVLIEEVLASGIPVLILDPKGDMSNLLLNFPSLASSDFEPWVDSGEARRQGVSTAELATTEAKKWEGGLSASGITPEHMRAITDGVDLRVVTPGSTVGIPINLVGDLSPPEESFDEAAETIRDEIEGLVSGLLALVDIEADPLTSREHILLSNLVENAWRSGEALELATLLRQVQDPPMRRLGVFELDVFYPAAERMKLAMRLNGLMASPSFAEWMIGEPLDIETLLWAPDGRPRATILHLAHLSDAERMFVATLVLTKFVTWMRSQPGTSELRAMIYADEVMGLAPPTAEPPSKRPILTLYKQARAHGVGLVMATQNPVDLDYKLMSNAGTWMVGRLQTERDKARIIEGLRSASGAVDVSAWDARIGELGKRQFLLKSTKSAEPTLFTTRWAMSYLRGPLTRTELATLQPSTGSAVEDPSSAIAAGGREANPARTEDSVLAEDELASMPLVADGVPVRFLDSAVPWAPEVGIGQGSTQLEPGLAVRVHLLFDERVGDIRHEEEWEAIIFPLSEATDPASAHAVDYDDRDFRRDPPEGATYMIGESALAKKSFFKGVERSLEEYIARDETLELFRNRELKLYGRPGETREVFEKRCEAAAEDRADEAAEKIRDRYETRVKSAQRRLSQAERRVRELDVDHGQRKQQELISGAGEVLSMFLGGRRRTRSLSGMASRRSTTVRTKERLRSAVDKTQEIQETIEDLEDDLAQEISEIWERWETAASEVDSFEVPLERTDVRLEGMTLFWACST
jgi:hypothetical protein